MRHVLGTPYLGQPKAIAFRGFLEKQAPGCKCFSIHEDLFRGDRERLREVIEQYRPTRILAATDSLHVQYMCQMAALCFDIPLMAVWCDNNAVEGEIFLWETGQAQQWMPGRAERGCYGCLRPPNAPSLTRSASFEYSSDDPDSYGGEPALGIFINRISNIASIIMVAWMLRTRSDDTLLGGVLDLPYVDNGCQYIRLGGPYLLEAEGRVTASGPWSVDWYRVKKEEACPFCSDEGRNDDNLFPASGNDPPS